MEDAVTNPLIKAISDLIYQTDKFDVNTLNLTKISARRQWKHEGLKLEDEGLYESALEAYKLTNIGVVYKRFG